MKFIKITVKSLRLYKLNTVEKYQLFTRHGYNHRLLKERTGYYAARSLELGSEYEKGCIF